MVQDRGERSDQSPPKNEPEGDAAPVGLDEALELTGFGRFNYKILLGLWLGLSTQNFVSTDISYALPAAECDLQLTATVKGWINAAMYVGMMLTAFVFGALSDALGRKSLLLFAFFSLGASGVATALVTSSWALIVCRVVLGSLLIGPASLALTHAGETFGPRYRSKMFMWAGAMQGTSAATHAALAMWIIPQQLQWLRSWRVFLLMSALVASCSGLYTLLLPESPKYLAGRGREREAIGVLSGIYAANTGLPASTYPVKSLRLAKHAETEKGNPFLVMARQFAKLVQKPYLVPLLFAIAMQPLLMFCMNTMRMWVPHIFAQMERDAAGGRAGGRDVCALLEDSRAPGGHNGSALAYDDCDNYRVDASVYLNSIIIMTSRAAIQMLASFVIRPVGPKILLVLGLLAGAGTLTAWPFAASREVVLGLSCVFEGVVNVAHSAILNIVVDLFPTGVRSSAFSLSNFTGRAGSMVGNVVFPMLFVSNCSAAFWIAASLLVVAAVIASFKPRPSFTPTPSTGLASGIANKAFELTVNSK